MISRVGGEGKGREGKGREGKGQVKGMIKEMLPLYCGCVVW